MKISWIVPVFNAGAFLNDAIKSILDNHLDGAASEIVLVDDCSTDPDTLLLLDHWSKNPVVKLIRQPQNGGPARARNTGMQAACGDWLAFLDADDMLAPGTLKMRLEAIVSHPEIAWVAGDMVEIRKPGIRSHHNSFPYAQRDGKQIGAHLFEINDTTKRLAGWPMLPFMGTMMFRQSLLEQTGYFDESLVYGEDIHFCLVLSRFATLYWIDVPALELRRYHESMTKNMVRGAREAPLASLACLRDPRLQSIQREMRWHYAANLRQSSGVFLKNGMRGAALKAALKAVMVSPNDMRGLKILLACLGLP